MKEEWKRRKKGKEGKENKWGIDSERGKIRKVTEYKDSKISKRVIGKRMKKE